MDYRVLFLVPEGLTFEMLTEEQQADIQKVFGQYVLPMPGTIPANGKVVCDGLAAENFDPATLGPLGLPFEIIGLWKEDGTVIVPLNETDFIAHLPDKVIYDEENGLYVGTSSPVLHEPHSWAGWPKLFGV